MKRGEVYLACLDPVLGSEQAGTRPVLVIESDALNSFLKTCLVVPLTTNLRWQEMPFCVRIPEGEAGLRSESVALCHQTRVLDQRRLMSRWGRIDDSTQESIDQALRFTISD